MTAINYIMAIDESLPSRNAGEWSSRFVIFSFKGKTFEKLIPTFLLLLFDFQRKPSVIVRFSVCLGVIYQKIGQDSSSLSQRAVSSKISQGEGRLFSQQHKVDNQPLFWNFRFSHSDTSILEKILFNLHRRCVYPWEFRNRYLVVVCLSGLITAFTAVLQCCWFALCAWLMCLTF